MSFSLKSKLVFAFFLLLMVTVAQAGFAETRYNKYNIHTQFRDATHAIASYANYTDPGQSHYIVPAGTKIDIVKKNRKKFIFTFDDSGKEVKFEFHEARMGMTVDEYIEKITSASPVSLAGLSKRDRDGVKQGKALTGMTRKGVMTALGYPAAHATLSLDDPTWIYWTNRYRKRAVTFNDKGIVVSVR